jgi:hypothetical protein
VGGNKSGPNCFRANSSKVFAGIFKAVVVELAGDLDLGSGWFCRLAFLLRHSESVPSALPTTKAD